LKELASDDQKESEEKEPENGGAENSGGADNSKQLSFDNLPETLPLKIQWKKTSYLPFTDIKGIKNAYEYRRSLYKCRDGEVQYCYFLGLYDGCCIDISSKHTAALPLPLSIPFRSCCSLPALSLLLQEIDANAAEDLMGLIDDCAGVRGNCI
jgi:hypothetical protein